MDTGRDLIHVGKTQIWNKSGRCPPGCEGIFEAARVAEPHAVVWKGDQTLPTDQQGVVVLRAPLGHAHFRQRSTRFSAGFLLCKISSARGFCCHFVLPRGPTISFGWCNLTGQSHSLLLTMRTCGTVLRSCWTEGAAVVESPSSIWGVGVAERRSIPDCRVLGQLGRFTPTNSGKASPHCRPCRISRRQQSPGRSNLQGTSCGCWIRCPRVGGVERTFLQGVVWPSCHRRIEPSLDPKWSICWHPVHLFTSGGRVALGTSVVFGAPSLSLLTSAGAAVPLTSVATTGQLVGGQGCWDVEGSRWRVQQLASAERQGGGSQSTSAWLISIFFRQGGSTTGRLRLWQTDFLCSMARNSQWTQPWCLLSEGMGVLVASADHDGAALEQARRQKENTYPELARPRGGRTRLVVLGCEMGGRWSDEARDFVSQLAKAKSRREPPQLRFSVRHAWFRRWSTLLACSAARSFGLSLLEHRGGFGVDGETPSTTAVLEEFGHECLDW